MARCSSFRHPAPASAVSYEFCNHVKVTYLLCDRLKTLWTPGFGCCCTTFTFVVRCRSPLIWFLLASEIDREYLSQGYYYPQISISLRNLGRSALDIFHQAEKQATVNILETTIIFTLYLLAGKAGNKKLLKILSLDNLVPRAFPLKNGWGKGGRCHGLFLPHPFFKGKALGMRLVARACALMAWCIGPSLRIAWFCPPPQFNGVQLKWL